MQFIAQPTGHAFPTFNFLDGSITNIGQDRVGTTLSKTYEFTDNFAIVRHERKPQYKEDNLEDPLILIEEPIPGKRKYRRRDAVGFKSRHPTCVISAREIEKPVL